MAAPTRRDPKDGRGEDALRLWPRAGGATAGTLAGEVVQFPLHSAAPVELENDAQSKRIAADAGQLFAKKVDGSTEVAGGGGTDHFDVMAPHASLITQTAYVLAIFAVIALPADFLAAWTIDRIGRRRIQTGGFIMIAGGLLLPVARSGSYLHCGALPDPVRGNVLLE